jgi:hypothetical protein
MAPTVVVTPGQGKAANDFAADHTACAALADQQIAMAKNAANNQIVGNALLNAVAGAGNSAGAGASKSTVAANAATRALSAGVASEQAAQDTLQRQFDIAYSQCMYAKGDIVPGFGSPVATSPSFAPNLLQTARSTLLGVWRGSYVCGQGETGVQLSFNELRSDGGITGTFSFFSLPGQNNAANGECTLTGQLDLAGQQLSFDPGTWINQPPGYAAVGFSAPIPSPTAPKIVGTITYPGCSQINANKMSG